jgi:hemolysin-activating ACP:hemolysin acyltransferase
MDAEQHNWSCACIICHKRKNILYMECYVSQQDTAPQSQWGGGGCTVSLTEICPAGTIFGMADEMCQRLFTSRHKSYKMVQFG